MKNKIYYKITCCVIKYRLYSCLVLSLCIVWMCCSPNEGLATALLLLLVTSEPVSAPA